MKAKGSITIQSDKTLLLDTHHARFDAVRNRIINFAELLKTPTHIHFYRITPISLWNASANGVSLEYILSTLEENKKYDLPKNVVEYIKRHYFTYGQVVLEKLDEDHFFLHVKSENNDLIERIEKYAAKFISEKRENGYVILKQHRGEIKAKLIKHLIPVQDIAGYDTGNKLSFQLQKKIGNRDFGLRYYQSEAVYIFSNWKEGSGVIVLPCGAGKTVVGIGIMNDIQEYTLIITTSVDSVKQWKRELLEKTTLQEEQIGEYTGNHKDLKPITITTYNMLIYRKSSDNRFKNMDVFGQQNWGLIIYDEVHILPAPIFRMTTAIQSKRRLGLTATLVREDNLESEVFTLIGPKIYEYPWKTLEKEGWIAEAVCYEIRIPLKISDYTLYQKSNNRTKFRIASENSNKINIVEHLISKHKKNHILIIGHYLDQLKQIAKVFNFPLITGNTPIPEREDIFKDFREGKIQCLVISKVGNFSIDLPQADVAIQISGVFGSRQEEAQRLGRILRPQSDKSYFYTLITKDSVEEDFSKKRQLFLVEQGYQYTVVDYRPEQPQKTKQNSHIGKKKSQREIFLEKL